MTYCGYHEKKINLSSEFPFIEFLCSFISETNFEIAMNKFMKSEKKEAQRKKREKSGVNENILDRKKSLNIYLCYQGQFGGSVTRKIIFQLNFQLCFDVSEVSKVCCFQNGFSRSLFFYFGSKRINQSIEIMPVNVCVSACFSELVCLSVSVITSHSEARSDGKFL